MNITVKELQLFRRLLVDEINAVASFAAIPDREDPGQQCAAEKLPGLENLLRRIDGEITNTNFVKKVQVEDA